MDIGRAVARPHADGGLAGGIGGADHAGAAGGENELHLRCPHELLGSRHLARRQAADGPCRGSGRFCRPGQKLRRRPCAFGCLRVGRKDNGAAGLYCYEGLVAHGGGGIGAGHNGGDDPHGHADLPQPFFRDFPQDALGFHGRDGGKHGFAGEEILLGFVLGVAEARLLHGHFGQGGALRFKGGGHGGNDGVQRPLVQFVQAFLGRPGLPGQLPGLLPGGQINIKLHRILLSRLPLGEAVAAPWAVTDEGRQAGPVSPQLKQLCF